MRISPLNVCITLVFGTWIVVQISMAGNICVWAISCWQPTHICHREKRWPIFEIKWFTDTQKDTTVLSWNEGIFFSSVDILVQFIWKWCDHWLLSIEGNYVANTYLFNRYSYCFFIIQIAMKSANEFNTMSPTALIYHRY